MEYILPVAAFVLIFGTIIYLGWRGKFHRPDGEAAYKDQHENPHG